MNPGDFKRCARALGVSYADHCSTGQPGLIRTDACPPRRRNAHHSVSRFKLIEKCPAAYAHRYVYKTESGPKAEAPEFGTLLHEVLEELFDWVVSEEYTGPLPEERTLEIYRYLWNKYECTGYDVYQEGANILREFVRRSPPVDHFKILAVEQEFNIKIGEFFINGFMDRVDKVDDETVRILDYKSNRLLFSRDEVDTDLQMSIYGIAGREIWPWAKKFEFAFVMLRHNTVIETKRTAQQLADCADYVIALGRHSEEMTEFPPKLNNDCSYCDYRMQCSAYLEAIEGRVQKLAVDKKNIASVALGREQAHKLAKIFYARKKELEDILRAQLEHVEELVVPEAKMKYRFLTVAQETVYPVDTTISLVQKYSGLSHDEISRRLLRVDKKSLEALLGELREDGNPRIKVIEAELEVVAQKRLEPRFDAQSIKDDPKPLKRPKQECASLPSETETKVLPP